MLVYSKQFQFQLQLQLQQQQQFWHEIKILHGCVAVDLGRCWGKQQCHTYSNCCVAALLPRRHQYGNHIRALHCGVLFLGLWW